MGVAEYVDQIVRVQDQATGPLGKMTAAADRLYGGLQSVVGVGGMLAGALSLKSAWDTTNRYLKSVKEVKELTGATASETDFLFSSARKAGVEYSQMQQVMFQLSRRGSMLEQTMAAANGRVPGLAKKFQRLGVDMTKGPVKAIENMSDAVKSGKLDAGELMAQFRIPQSQVNDFKGFLEDLDKAKLKAAKAGGPDLVSEDDIADFNKLEQAQHRFHDAWNRIQVMVVRKFFPVVATYAEQFADTLEKVIPTAVKGAQWLADHMVEIVRLAKVFAAVMTGRKLLQILGPGGMIGNMLMQAGGVAGGGLLTGAAGMASAPFKMLGGLLGQVGSVVTLFVRAVPVLAAIAAAVWAIHKGYQYITASVDGTFERIKVSFDMIRARWENLTTQLGLLWEQVAKIFGVDSDFSMFIGKLVTVSFEGLISGLDFFLHLLRTVAGYLGEVLETMGPDIIKGFDVVKTFIGGLVEDAVKGFGIMRDAARDLYNWIANSWFGQRLGLAPIGAADAVKLDFGWLQGSADLFMKHWNKTQEEDERLRRRLTRDRWVEEAKATTPEAPDKRPPAVNYDFRGSRFDITQNFAEGFDPDRIAVAFSEDLAALGERRTSSVYAPAFAAGR